MKWLFGEAGFINLEEMHVVLERGYRTTYTLCMVQIFGRLVTMIWKITPFIITSVGMLLEMTHDICVEYIIIPLATLKSNKKREKKKLSY